MKVFQMFIAQCPNSIMDEVHNLNSTSNRYLATNVISTSDHTHFLDIDIGCMLVHNLNSTSNGHLITNVIATSDCRYFLDIDIL